MSKEQHTPGPWSYEDPCDATCGWPCTEDGCPDNHPTGLFTIDGPEWDNESAFAYGPCTRREADARLIAAAPDLLAACDALVCFCIAQGWQGPGIDAGNAAIVKARGEG